MDRAHCLGAFSMTQTPARRPLHVSLFAGPGVGKTTTLHGLLYFLKREGRHCEGVLEVAKDLHYLDVLKDTSQEEILKAQAGRMATALMSGAEVIVTDAPLLLGLAYCTPEEAAKLEPVVQSFQSGWDMLDVLLVRDLNESYQPQGRRQSRDEAIAFAEGTFNPWVRNRVGASLVELTADGQVVDTLLALIRERLTAPEA